MTDASGSLPAKHEAVTDHGWKERAVLFGLTTAAKLAQEAGMGKDWFLRAADVSWRYIERRKSHV